jgi:predicted DNA-binding transcriptional regulator AlpA
MTVNVTDSARALEPLLTVEDLEQLLRVDRRTVRRLCKRGQLPEPIKLGGGNRWRSQDIADAIATLQHRHRREELVCVG